MRASATACAALLGALAAAVAAGAAPLPLISPTAPGPAPPPLAGGQQLGGEEAEVRVPGTLVNADAVRVGVAQDGRPVGVVAVQRMTIHGLGDFRFVVPATATAAAPADGSQALPGLRQAGIVWQGFSPGTRTLGARITLLPAAAAAALPLGVSIERRDGFTLVHLENRTSKRLSLVTGTVSLRDLQHALAWIRRQLGRPGTPVFLQVAGTAGKQTTTVVDAPLHVSGTVSVAGGRTAKVDTTLGGGRPGSRTVRVQGTGRTKLTLDAALEPDPRRLLPTSGELAAARDPFATLQTALGRAAVSRQYQQFLASPRPDSQTSTTYRYVTARIAAAPAPASASGGGTSALTIVLAVVGGLLALGGLTVLWAHL